MISFYLFPHVGPPEMEALTLTYSKVISRARAIADRTSDGGAAR